MAPLSVNLANSLAPPRSPNPAPSTSSLPALLLEACLLTTASPGLWLYVQAGCEEQIGKKGAEYVLCAGLQAFPPSTSSRARSDGCGGRYVLESTGLKSILFSAVELPLPSADSSSQSSSSSSTALSSQKICVPTC